MVLADGMAAVEGCWLLEGGVAERTEQEAIEVCGRDHGTRWTRVEGNRAEYKYKSSRRWRDEIWSHAIISRLVLLLHWMRIKSSLVNTVPFLRNNIRSPTFISPTHQNI